MTGSLLFDTIETLSADTMTHLERKQMDIRGSPFSLPFVCRSDSSMSAQSSFAGLFLSYTHLSPMTKEASSCALCVCVSVRIYVPPHPPIFAAKCHLI